MTPSRYTDHQLELAIGRLLQAGVLLAAVVVAVGGIAMLAHHGQSPADFHTFRPLAELGSLLGIAHGVMSRDSQAIVQLGLVLLIATPIARVAFTLCAFVLQRDRLYVGITTAVLALLVYGLIWGRA